MIKKTLFTFIAFAVISFSANAELGSSTATPPPINNSNTLSIQPDQYVKAGTTNCFGTHCRAARCNSGDKESGIVSRSVSAGFGGVHSISERVLCNR